jgi:hypothetical protein
MLEHGIPDRDAWPDGVLDAVATFRQGDVVRDLPLFWWADPATAVHDITRRAGELASHERLVGPKDRARYGMVTTQTCDLALEGGGRPKSAWVQLAPVFDATATVGNGEPSHTDAQIDGIKKGQSNSKVWLPNIPEPGVWYADLSFEVTVERGWLSQRERIDGFGDETAREQIGVRLAWLRSRPALDGNFTTHVQGPLVDALRKAKKKRRALFERMHEQILEVAIRPDSRLNMTAVDIVVLHSGVDDEVRTWWEEQLVIAQANAQQCGIAVIGARLVNAEDLSAAEYRNMITMPLNNISPNAAVWGWGEE